MLLAIETATAVCGAALFDGERMVGIREDEVGRRHAELLPDIVRDILCEAGTSVADLAAIAVSIGPGSFTGLRIGLGFAKGLALSRGLAVHAVPTMSAILEGFPSEKASLLCLLHSHRDKVFHQRFVKNSGTWLPEATPSLSSWSDVAERMSGVDLVVHCGCDGLMAGLAAERLAVRLLPSARKVGQFALRHPNTPPGTDFLQLEPAYAASFGSASPRDAASREGRG